MKVVTFMGSPRAKGNTATMVQALTQGIADHVTKEIAAFSPAKMNIGPCRGCEACHKKEGRCIQQDDMQKIWQELTDAEVLVFATPLYWWGMTAQLKAVVDRFYAQANLLQGKKVLLLLTGGSAVPDAGYDLIRQQFEEICAYVGMKFLGCYCVQSECDDSIANDAEAQKEIYQLYNKLI